MLRNLWRLVRNVTITLGVMVTIIFLSELGRSLLFLYRINPILGYGGALVCGIAFLVVVIRLLRAWCRHPRVLSPPAIGDLEMASHYQLRDYCRYLSLYLRQLAANRHLSAEKRAQAVEASKYVDDTLRHHPLNEDLRLCISKTSQNDIVPILNQLGDLAEREVRNSVRDVMAGVMLGPNPGLDLLVVLYRNFSMVGRIIGIYQSRPRVREQWMILRDIFAVVATVNFVNLYRKLIGNLAAQISILSRFVDTIAQGIGAGIFTSIAGHAAIARCAAFDSWDQEQQCRRLVTQSVHIFREVRLIMTNDLLSELKPRIQATLPVSGINEPGFWDTIENGIREAVDRTARSCETFFDRPVEIGLQQNTSITTSLAHGTAHRRGHVFKTSMRGAPRAWTVLTRALGTFTERVKYSIIGRLVNRS